MGERWWFADTGVGDPAWNMAFDEWLLLRAAERGAPFLRVYGWTVSAVTFGYFQALADVESRVAIRPLLRRPTGGGIVLHDGAEWTYSVAFPPGHEWTRLRAETSYRRIHEWLRGALEGVRIQSELTPEPVAGRAGECFSGAERFDLVSGAAKVAGAAQRRNRFGLLIQGSVRPPFPGADRDAWVRALRAVGTEAGVEWERWASDPGSERDLQTLCREKYAAGSDYHRRR